LITASFHGIFHDSRTWRAPPSRPLRSKDNRGAWWSLRDASVSAGIETRSTIIVEHHSALKPPAEKGISLSPMAAANVANKSSKSLI
jgi:hypothetical protein